MEKCHFWSHCSPPPGLQLGKRIFKSDPLFLHKMTNVTFLFPNPEAWNKSELVLWEELCTWAEDMEDGLKCQRKFWREKMGQLQLASLKQPQGREDPFTDVQMSHKIATKNYDKMWQIHPLCDKWWEWWKMTSVTFWRVRMWEWLLKVSDKRLTCPGQKPDVTGSQTEDCPETRKEAGRLRQSQGQSRGTDIQGGGMDSLSDR